MTIEYELTTDDYIDFNMYHMDNSEKIKKTIFFQRYIMSLILPIAPLIIILTTDKTFGEWYFSFVIVWAAWVIFYEKNFKKSIKKKLLKIADKGGANGIIGNHKLTLTEDKIIEHKDEDLSYEKSIINKVGETDKHIFIYISESNAYVVPKSAFNNKEEEEEFKKLLS